MQQLRIDFLKPGCVRRVFERGQFGGELVVGDPSAVFGMSKEEMANMTLAQFAAVMSQTEIEPLWQGLIAQGEARGEGSFTGPGAERKTIGKGSSIFETWGVNVGNRLLPEVDPDGQ